MIQTFKSITSSITEMYVCKYVWTVKLSFWTVKSTAAEQVNFNFEQGLLKLLAP